MLHFYVCLNNKIIGGGAEHPNLPDENRVKVSPSTVVTYFWRIGINLPCTFLANLNTIKLYKYAKKGSLQA